MTSTGVDVSSACRDACRAASDAIHALRAASARLDGEARQAADGIVRDAQAAAAHLPALAPLAAGITERLLPPVLQAASVARHYLALSQAGALGIVPGQASLDLQPPVTLGDALLDVLRQLGASVSGLARLTAEVRGQEAIASARAVTAATPGHWQRDHLIASPPPAPEPVLRQPVKDPMTVALLFAVAFGAVVVCAAFLAHVLGGSGDHPLPPSTHPPAHPTRRS